MTEFSIIIPLYNKEATIKSTVQSVLRQSYPHFEIVVVDDGSRDKSMEIVQSMEDDRIRIFQKVNGGPSSARNHGVAQASKEWILFLDADDLLLTDALYVFARAINSHPGIEIFSANYYWVQGNRRKLFASPYPEGIVKNAYKDWFLHRLMPRAGACAITRRLALEFPFKENLRRSEDTEVMFELMRNNAVYRIETPVMEYFLDNATESQIRRGIDKDFQGHLSFDSWKSLWERICLYELYVEAKNKYPDEVDAVYTGMGKHFLLKLAYHCAFWYRAFWGRSARFNQPKRI